MRKTVEFQTLAREIKDYPDRFGFLGSIAYDVLNLVYDHIADETGCEDEAKEFMWETKVKMCDVPRICWEPKHINIAMYNKADEMRIALRFDYHEDDNYIIDANVLVIYEPTKRAEIFPIQLEAFYDNSIHVVPELRHSSYPTYIQYDV